MGGDNGEKGKSFQEHLHRTHGQNQREVGSRVRSREGWGGGGRWGKMGTTVLEQKLNLETKRKYYILNAFKHIF